MEDLQLAELCSNWPVAGPWQVSALAGGTNNLVWRADIPDGQAYVLRLFHDLSALPKLRYEAALLQKLADTGLPFQLPVPLKTTTGEVFALFEQTGRSALATLTPLLPGKTPNQPAERNDPRNASLGGATLALLDEALASLPELLLPGDFQMPTTFGEITAWHPLVSDPLAVIEQLPIEREQAQQIRAFLRKAIESVPDLYARLPRQLLHRDFDPGNILVERQQITAVLDFEFMGRDIRVLDLVVALSWWPIYVQGTGREWGLIEALGRAYTERIPLSEEELHAIPAVLRLRDAVSFVHRVGRYLAGLENDARIKARVEHSLWREAWLAAEQQSLLKHVMSWA